MPQHPLNETTTVQRRKTRQHFGQPQHDRRMDKQGWTWAKEIIGTIIGVMPMVIGVFLWGVSVETRDAKTQEALAGIRATVATQENQRVERTKELNDRLISIENKIDRIAERQK